MEINRLEILQSYIATRNLLGLANPDKNQIVNLAFEETATELFVKNSVTNKKLLLLNRPFTRGASWRIATTYPRVEPLANYLKIHLKGRNRDKATDTCLKAIEGLLNYKS